MTRLDVLQKLLDDYQQNVEDYDEGEEEDLRPYFAGEKECGKWCCVTVHYSQHRSAKFFFLPEFDALHAAEMRAVEFANDDIFEELPVAVVNLDNGEAFKPDYRRTGWRVGTPVLDGPSTGAQC